MPHFDSMMQQKQKLREALLQNQDVVNLLVNAGDNVLAFQDVKTGSKSPAAKLIKTHFYIPGTTTKDKNFIMMRRRVVYNNTNVVKETSLIVYIIGTEYQIDLLQGSWADLLADAADRILINSPETLIRMGGFHRGLASASQFIDGYSGWEIPYVTHEFNRRADLI